MIESFRLGCAAVEGRIDRRAGEVRTESRLSLGWWGSGPVGRSADGPVPDLRTPLGDQSHRALAAVLVVIFAFFFVTVSSRIVGLVGVTSNPTSGMTIASLLGTSPSFSSSAGRNRGQGGALTVGCVVAIAASIAGDTSQDLKTGFLLGATPRRQQVGSSRRAHLGGIRLCLTVILLAGAYGFGTESCRRPRRL